MEFHSQQGQEVVIFVTLLSTKSSGRGVKLNAQLNLLPRTRGVLSQLHHMSPDFVAHLVKQQQQHYVFTSVYTL
jgi:hypothetical protein